MRRTRAQTVGGSDFEIVAVNPRDRRDDATLITGRHRRTRRRASSSTSYPARKLYVNRRQLVFGGGATSTDKSTAVRPHARRADAVHAC